MSEDEWVERAKTNFVGRKIVNVRYMTHEEAYAHSWNSRTVVFELDDGSFFYPSMDDEGNGAGAIFGSDRFDKDISIPVFNNA